MQSQNKKEKKKAQYLRINIKIEECTLTPCEDFKKRKERNFKQAADHVQK